MSRPASGTDLQRTFRDLSDDALAEMERAAPLSRDAWFSHFQWSELLHSERIVIISEAGSGKTYECRQCQRRLWTEGQPAFYLELAELAASRIEDLLSPDEEKRLIEWRSSASTATFFLDSVDELNLTQGSFRTALTKLARAMDGQISRARLVITSRPIPFDERLIAEILPIPEIGPKPVGEEDFADVALDIVRREKNEEPSHRWRRVALCSLSDAQIEQIVTSQGVEHPEALLADIRRRNTQEFAERPQDLIELCSQWRSTGQVASYRAQVSSAIGLKLRQRADRREESNLSPDRAFEGASRLALAATLARKLTFRHSAESDTIGTSGIAIDPADILFDWEPAELATLIQRPLFGFASYGRVRFYHRSAIEYLAASQLSYYLSKGNPISGIKRLIFTTTAQGDDVVRPSMRPLAAWLSLENDSIFSGVCERNPELLLDFGDPDSLSISQKLQALNAFALRYRSGGWRGLHIPAVQVGRFADSGLAQLMLDLWPSIENCEVKELLLNLAAECKMTAFSDIAFTASLQPGEDADVRIAALTVLAQISDIRLPEVVSSLVQNSAIWPSNLAKQAIISLFPRNIGVSILTALLTRLSERENSVSYLNYHFPNLIKDCVCPNDYMADLSSSLAGLLVENLTWSAYWPHYRSARPFLAPALAAACLRQLKTEALTPRLANQITLVLRLQLRESVDEHLKLLNEYIDGANPAARSMLFWSDDEFRQHHHPVRDPIERLYAVIGNPAMRLSETRDAEWVRDALRDSERQFSDREMMMHAAMQSYRPGSGTWVEYLLALRQDVDDCFPLKEYLRIRIEAPPPPVNAERVAEEREIAERQTHNASREAENRRSWVILRQELANDSDHALGADRVDNTVWNLWRAMSNVEEHNRGTGWQRSFLESHFGKATADRVKAAFLKYWRTERPTLASERIPSERNNYLTRWSFGLAAIFSEAEDQDWATKLSQPEAELACRYAPIHLNGLPKWLDDLVLAHPRSAGDVLGSEFTAQLDETLDFSSTTSLVRDVSHSSDQTIDFFRPRVRVWLDKCGDRGAGDAHWGDSKLDCALKIIQHNASQETLCYACDIAMDRLARGHQEPMAKIWLAMLMRLDPEKATSVLENWLSHLRPEEDEIAAGWFAGLFGDGHRIGSVSLSRPAFTPGLLLRLTKAAYTHVSQSSDIYHEGVYSPSVRDNAQHARNALFSAILNLTGPEGWKAKLELSNDPMFAATRDRVIALARENSAHEADGDPVAISAIQALERYGEASAQTRDDIFQIMNDRMDDINDLLLQDESPREGWALIMDERVMRRAISLQPKQAANRAYTIDQESVTADEKETDIRFRSTVSNEQGVIELKIGEKPRSASDLKQALSEQLVRKYMAADNCKAGLLVITSCGRGWRHPETRAKLDLDELIAYLNEEARKLTARMGGGIRLSVRGINLVARLFSERLESKK